MQICRRMSWMGLLLATTVAAVASAQPRAVITGPKESRCGSLVVLDASESTGTSRLWLLAVSPEETSFLPVESGRQCIFASPVPGTYRFVLVVAGNNANGGPSADMTTHSVTLRGNAPPPPPPPPPPDDPTDPTVPPATTGAAYLIILRHNQDLSVDQAATLAKLRTWSDARPDKVSQLEFSPDESDARVAAYAAKVPSGQALPYAFLVRPRKDGKGAAILWSGPLPAQPDELQAKVEALK